MLMDKQKNHREHGETYRQADHLNNGPMSQERSKQPNGRANSLPDRQSVPGMAYTAGFLLCLTAAWLLKNMLWAAIAAIVLYGVFFLLDILLHHKLLHRLPDSLRTARLFRRMDAKGRTLTVCAFAIPPVIWVLAAILIAHMAG